MLWVRLARCRVETMRGTPCRWRVRGLLGTCDYHVGEKWGLPTLVPTGSMSLPQLMWSRRDGVPGSRPEPQPVGTGPGSDVARRASARSSEGLVAVVTVLSLLVATASFVRDVVAG
jgi:hypothetical protein